MGARMYKFIFTIFLGLLIGPLDASNNSGYERAGDVLSYLSQSSLPVDELSFCVTKHPPSDEFKHIVEFKPGDFRDVAHFLESAATDATLALTFTRSIALLANFYKLNKFGFVFTEGRDCIGAFCFFFQAKKDNNDLDDDEKILLTSDYNSDHPFKEYLDTLQGIHETTHNLSIRSLSGNYLTIPKGPYISVYDFSQKASDEEIMDCWQHMHELSGRIDEFIFNTHAGTNGHQMVPHLHWRFKLI
jgi:hypothetical protein